jgi:hypothetical protein
MLVALVLGDRLGRLLYPFVVPGQIPLKSIYLVREHSKGEDGE